MLILFLVGNDWKNKRINYIENSLICIIFFIFIICIILMKVILKWNWKEKVNW